MGASVAPLDPIGQPSAGWMPPRFGVNTIKGFSLDGWALWIALLCRPVSSDNSAGSHYS